MITSDGKRTNEGNQSTLEDNLFKSVYLVYADDLGCIEERVCIATICYHEVATYRFKPAAKYYTYIWYTYNQSSRSQT